MIKLNDMTKSILRDILYIASGFIIGFNINYLIKHSAEIIFLYIAWTIIEHIWHLAKRRKNEI